MVKSLDKIDDLREFFDELREEKERVEKAREEYAGKRTREPSRRFPYGSHQSAKEGC